MDGNPTIAKGKELEVDLRAKLDLTRRVRSCDQPQTSAHARPGIAPVRLVEDIECVRLQEQTRFTEEDEVLPQRQVRREVPRPQYIAHWGSTERRGARSCKRSR